MIREIIELEGPNPYGRRLEFYEEGKVLGYINYSLIYDRMELDNIYVDESRRKEGIGKKLLGYLVAVAIDSHVINITLEVRVSNEIARNLYKQFGFREVALRRFYYGDEDGILMEKQVM
ncbi:MAG: GNAT family N-acetyltransferase [Bacilli bacterium]|nr:GNAT family N-acetyltransferase [Bacilli bacterium]